MGRERGDRHDSQGQYVQITGANPVPTAFYATRVSAKLAWIYGVTDPTGDFDGDGLPNLMEYALNRNPLAADQCRRYDRGTRRRFPDADVHESHHSNRHSI
jgi:hypothetical protein